MFVVLYRKIKRKQGNVNVTMRFYLLMHVILDIWQTVHIKEFSDEDIKKVSDIFHAWRGKMIKSMQMN